MGARCRGRRTGGEIPEDALVVRAERREATGLPAHPAGDPIDVILDAEASVAAANKGDGAVSRPFQHVPTHMNLYLGVDIVRYPDMRTTDVGRVVPVADLIPVAGSAEVGIDVLVARLHVDRAGRVPQV